MKFGSCSREREVSALIARGHWPEACGDELRAHVSACRNCGDLVLMMQAFHSARSAAMHEAVPVPAGVLWWRAQLRRRKAAMESIGRPIMGAQIFAWSVTAVFAVVFAVSQAKHGIEWLTWLRQLPQSGTFHLQELLPTAFEMPSWVMPLLVFAAIAALLSGVVLYIDRQRQLDKRQ